MSDRAVSTTVSYVLALGITTLLASGLILAGGQFVTDQRQQAIDTELRILGEQLATDLERADRIVQASPTRVETLQINRSMPDAVAGSGYAVELTDGPSPTLRLWTETPAVAVTIPVNNQTALDPVVVNGGSVTVRYDPGADVIEVSDD